MGVHRRQSASIDESRRDCRCSRSNATAIPDGCARAQARAPHAESSPGRGHTRVLLCRASTFHSCQGRKAGASTLVTEGWAFVNCRLGRACLTRRRRQRVSAGRGLLHSTTEHQRMIEGRPFTPPKPGLVGRVRAGVHRRQAENRQQSKRLSVQPLDCHGDPGRMRTCAGENKSVQSSRSTRATQASWTQPSF